MKTLTKIGRHQTPTAEFRIMECVSVGHGFTFLPLLDVERYRVPDLETVEAHGPLERKQALIMLRDSVLLRNRSALAALLGN